MRWVYGIAPRWGGGGGVINSESLFRGVTICDQILQIYITIHDTCGDQWLSGCVTCWSDYNRKHCTTLTNWYLKEHFCKQDNKYATSLVDCCYLLKYSKSPHIYLVTVKDVMLPIGKCCLIVIVMSYLLLVLGIQSNYWLVIGEIHYIEHLARHTHCLRWSAQQSVLHKS